jgi:hypothetical protein
MKTISPDMPKPSNHPAFPVNAYPGGNGIPPIRPNSGMGIRDWFAGLALQGYRASEKFCTAKADAVAELAFMDADAMLVRRER